MCVSVLGLAGLGATGYGISRGIEDIGSAAKPEDISAPVASPQPKASPQPGEEQASAETKRQKTAALKYGAMSTIRNRGGAAGVSGAGADLNNPQAQAGKDKLG